MGFDVDAELNYTVRLERLKPLSVCLLHMQRTLAVKSVAAVLLPSTRVCVRESHTHTQNKKRYEIIYLYTLYTFRERDEYKKKF